MKDELKKEITLMARQVLLSFDGAAEIPITPYQRTQDREAEVPAVPGILTIPGTPAIPGLAGFPGFAEGEVTQWRKEEAVTSGFDFDVNPLAPGRIDPGRVSFYLPNAPQGFRWYSTITDRSWYDWQQGFIAIQISPLDAFGTNREQELLDTPIGIPFYIYHLEVSPNDLVFRWKVTTTQAPVVSEAAPGEFNAGLRDVYMPVDSALEVYNGVDWDDVPLSIHATYNGIGIFAGTGTESVSTDPQANWNPLLWGVSGIGGGGAGAIQTRIDEVRTYETTSQSTSGDVVTAGQYAIDDRRLTYHWDTQTAGNRTAFLEAGDRIRLPSTVDIDLDITVSIQAYAGLTLIWGGDVRARVERAGEIELHVSSIQIIEPPPGEGTEHMWEDVVSWTIEWARFVTPESSPEVPPFGGTPGTPAGPDTPAVPGIPGIPAVRAIYEGAMYGRPAIPPFGIWAERLGMIMSHRVENELEIIDLTISGHDYIIRQDWVAPKDHRVRPFCWMKDERQIVQTVETVDQTDEKTTRFSTMAIVNGPANASAVPLPADFQEGDDILEPSFRIQPEVVNHVFEVHEAVEDDPADIIIPPGGDVPTEAQVRAIVDQRLEDQLLELTIRPATATGVAGEPPTLYYSRTGLFICPIFLELLPKVSFTIPEGRRIVDIFDSGATVTDYFTVDPNNARRWVSNFEYGPNAGLELVINTEAI